MIVTLHDHQTFIALLVFISLCNFSIEEYNVSINKYSLALTIVHYFVPGGFYEKFEEAKMGKLHPGRTWKGLTCGLTFEHKRLNLSQPDLLFINDFSLSR